MNQYFLLFLATCWSNSAVISGHVILTKPMSKNNGNFTTPSLPSSSYFGLASFGIIDKAFFDGDNSVTPWTRPGEFDFYSAKNVVPNFPQLLHPCGCNAAVDVHHCAGVSDVASGFGETTLGAISGTPPRISPPSWVLGSTQETAWNAHTNHGGGYIYMLCKKTDFDECRDLNFPNGPLMATEDESDNYLQCVWDCFESNTLEWDDAAVTNDESPPTQRLQYEDDECTYATTEPQTKVGKDNHIWRSMPIPEKAQITNGGEGLCTWDSLRSFSNSNADTKFIDSFGGPDVCDTGPDAHHPQKWHIVDQVKVPSDIQTGEYILSWQYNADTADQMWSNCADIEIVRTPPPQQQANNQNELCSSDSPIIPAPVQPNNTPNTPSNEQDCLDNPLPGNWGTDGRTCDTYENLGISYCTHGEVNNACCFCGGGRSIAVIEEEEHKEEEDNEKDTPSTPDDNQLAPVCKDDSKFKFNGKMKCKKIKKMNKKKRKKICKKKHHKKDSETKKKMSVSFYCPKTCKVCS